MSDRKKPTAGFWFVVTLVALVVYPLSKGPFLVISKWIPETPRLWIGLVYLPVNEAMMEGPDWFAKPYIGYLRIWQPRYADAMERFRDRERERAQGMRIGPASDENASDELPESDLPGDGDNEVLDDPDGNSPSATDASPERN